MPKPKEWTSVHKLVKDLKKYDLEKWCREEKKLNIARSAVSNNTFRAFHNLRKKPSRSFQDWALRVINGKFLVRLRAIDSQPDYDRWLRTLVQDFQEYWQKEVGREIPYGPSFKLPNLLMKRLFLYGTIPKRVVKFLHVPLDSYTIRALRKCWMSLPGSTAIGKIPSGATMSFVRDPNTYEVFQRGIREIARRAKVSPITLDCLAWDAGHRNDR